MSKIAERHSDLSGLWKGHYTYLSAQDIGEWPFKARIHSKGTAFSGLVVERHMHGLGEVKAQVSGTVEAASVTFIKTYPEHRHLYHYEVRYEGRLNSERNRIEGIWEHDDGSGEFAMELVR